MRHNKRHDQPPIRWAIQKKDRYAFAGAKTQLMQFLCVLLPIKRFQFDMFALWNSSILLNNFPEDSMKGKVICYGVNERRNTYELFLATLDTHLPFPRMVLQALDFKQLLCITL